MFMSNSVANIFRKRWYLWMIFWWLDFNIFIIWLKDIEKVVLRSRRWWLLVTKMWIISFIAYNVIYYLKCNLHVLCMIKIFIIRLIFPNGCWVLKRSYFGWHRSFRWWFYRKPSCSKIYIYWCHVWIQNCEYQ